MSGGVQPDRPHARASARQMLAIGAVASILGVALALLIDWFPVAASEQAGPIDTLWDVLLIVSVPIFVLVQTVVLFAVWKFRMRRGEEQLDGPPIHGNTRLEIIWTAVPAVILVALCSYAYVVLRQTEAAQANALKVRVVGEQFAWSFHYPGPGGREIASNELYLPVNRAVDFQIQSKDVLHDFWIPAFRIKRDAVPGLDQSYRIKPTQAGEYPIVCAELCGLGHSVMRSTVRVVSRARFDQWLQGRQQAAAGAQQASARTVSLGAAAPAPSGRAVFTSSEANCGACHTLAAAGTSGTIGPDLGARLRGHSRAEIRAAILRPDADVPDGYSRGIMPANYGATLGPAEVDALVRYLSRTKGTERR